MKSSPLLLALTFFLLFITAGASYGADRVISSKTEYFPLEAVVKKEIDLDDFELFFWEAVKVTSLTGQNPWDPLNPGKGAFPPGRGTFTQNWSDGRITTGAIVFDTNGMFTQRGTGGGALPFSSSGSWTYNARSGVLTIIYTSYVLEGATIIPGPGDTWNTLWGTLNNGKGKLRDAGGSWSVDVSG